MNIVLTGSVAYDYLMTFPGVFKDHILVDKLETISLSFLVDSLIRRRGGIATNVAYSMALLGQKPKVLATVGSDFGEYKALFDQVGVDTSLIKVIDDKFTASFFATTDQQNSQLASFYPGAMDDSVDLSLHDLEEKPDLVVVSPTAPAAMDKYIAECKELDIPFLYDPSQQLARMSGESVRNGIDGAWAVFVNEYEYGLVEKLTGYDREKILSEVKILVVTKGEKGSEITIDGETFEIPVIQPNVVKDPTGGGDAFRAGFLTGYANGMDWQTCGQMGALTATYCLENDGPQGQSYTTEAYIKRYRQHFDDNGMLDKLIK